MRQPQAFAASLPALRMLKRPTSPMLHAQDPGGPQAEHPITNRPPAGAKAPFQPREATGDAGFDPLKPHL
jgi:hypothetical protein